HDGAGPERRRERVLVVHPAAPAAGTAGPRLLEAPGAQLLWIRHRAPPSRDAFNPRGAGPGWRPRGVPRPGPAWGGVGCSALRGTPARGVMVHGSAASVAPGPPPWSNRLAARSAGAAAPGCGAGVRPEAWRRRTSPARR